MTSMDGFLCISKLIAYIFGISTLAIFTLLFQLSLSQLFFNRLERDRKPLSCPVDRNILTRERIRDHETMGTLT